eukprot:COSAG06_NODE_7849_length_2353_cov_3.108696_3_plen_155_part_00
MYTDHGGGVEDTWGAVCCGKTNALWSELPCGAPTLRQWLGFRLDDSRPFSFDLIVVAWDYTLTPNGTNPGVDSAAQDQALPAGRTALVVKEIERATEHRQSGSINASSTHGRPHPGFGLSSDLTILEADGRVSQRDGPNASICTSARSSVRSNA